MSGFKQSADLWHPPILSGPEASDARKAIVAEQPPGFGEFRGSAFGVASEAVGRCSVDPIFGWTSSVKCACSRS
jgi:hypothetical protein